MKRIALIATAILTLMAATAAQAVTLVNPNGTPVGGIYQRWVDQSKISTYKGVVAFSTVGGCNGAVACTDAPQTIRGPYQAWVGGGPLSIVDTSQANSYLDRNSLYFELGHVFDAAVLTPADRRKIALAFHNGQWHWWDTTAGVAKNGEDGLEGMFAAVYQDCAWGYNDSNSSMSSFEPHGVHPPQIEIGANPCILIQQIADEHRTTTTAGETAWKNHHQRSAAR